MTILTVVVAEGKAEPAGSNEGDKTKKSKKNSAPKEDVVSEAPPVPAPKTSGGAMELIYHDLGSTVLSRTVAAMVNARLELVQSKEITFHQPVLVSPVLGSISSDTSIARYLIRSSKDSKYLPSDPWLASQCDQWMDAYVAAHAGIYIYPFVYITYHWLTETVS